MNDFDENLQRWSNFCAACVACGLDPVKIFRELPRFQMSQDDMERDFKKVSSVHPESESEETAP